jgi:C4-dicarboxylate transporter DctM subunit
MTAVLFGSLALLFLINVPIALALGIASSAALLYKGNIPLLVVAQRMFTGTDSFPLMAIPFFMLAGALMDTGGISRRLVRFANSLVGHIPGGLAHVAALSAMFFAAVSGSGAATTAAIGSMLIPALLNKGYRKDFAVCLLGASGPIGIIIPPSIPFVLYGVSAGVSIGKLFLAGIVPGIMMGIGIMIVNYIYAKKEGYQPEKRATASEVFSAFIDAFPALLMPLIILGGILGGIFTPTEAAVVAVVYGLLVGVFVYRELKWQHLSNVLTASAISTGVVMLLLAIASTFGWIMTSEQIPQKIAAGLLSISNNPYVILLIINILLLIIGTFMETTPALILLVPVLYPVIMKMGIDPIHFGVVMVTNLAIGMLTPPLGLCLFVSCNIADAKMSEVMKPILPFLAATVTVLMLVTYFPQLSLWLPNLLIK